MLVRPPSHPPPPMCLCGTYYTTTCYFVVCSEWGNQGLKTMTCWEFIANIGLANFDGKILGIQCTSGWVLLGVPPKQVAGPTNTKYFYLFTSLC